MHVEAIYDCKNPYYLILKGDLDPFLYNFL